MSDRVQRIDLHSHLTSSGSVVVSHFVDAEVTASQSLVRVNSEPVLLEGDTFDVQHQPTVGPFQSPLPRGTGEGRLEQAGQSLLKINQVFVATHGGTNTSCTESVREMTNRATMILGGRSIVKVNGAAVLIGR